jgi:hypothetical protein
MSVIIKGMKKPNKCRLCALVNTQLINEKGTIHQCYYKGKIIEDVEYVPDFCPLVEIPVEHGRLIDADAVHQFLNEQTTIIPAEGKKQ